MAYLVDTNIVIHARDGTAAVLEKFAAHDGAIQLSALCLAELERGARKAGPEAELRRARLEVLLPRIPVVPFDSEAARAYGRIIAQCGWTKGRDFDRMIAGHALSTRSILVTDNVGDFADIPGLAIENWAT
ncbi:MAG: type II toxin-antitoxin system VapC family toxin [Parvularculaceae bacterium]